MALFSDSENGTAWPFSLSSDSSSHSLASLAPLKFSLVEPTSSLPQYPSSVINQMKTDGFMLQLDDVNSLSPLDKHAGSDSHPLSISPSFGSAACPVCRSHPSASNFHTHVGNCFQKKLKKGNSSIRNRRKKSNRYNPYSKSQKMDKSIKKIRKRVARLGLRQRIIFMEALNRLSRRTAGPDCSPRTSPTMSPTSNNLDDRVISLLYSNTPFRAPDSPLCLDLDAESDDSSPCPSPSNSSDPTLFNSDLQSHNQSNLPRAPSCSRFLYQPQHTLSIRDSITTSSPSSSSAASAFRLVPSVLRSTATPALNSHLTQSSKLDVEYSSPQVAPLIRVQI